MHFMLLRDKTAALKNRRRRIVTLEIVDEFFPADNAHSAIDEAHATGLFVPGGCGTVALLELVDCVLPTLGKSPTGSGGA
jgi:7-keto-8-aminopelargonate synthetase-like enzyme